MDRVLITGGSGFIGSHFHKSIDNSNLVNLDLLPPPFKHSATFINGDIRKQEDVDSALAGRNITTILSLAAKHHDFGIGHDEYFDTNEGGTEVLCRAATKFNIKKIIFYSSVAVYGLKPVTSSEEMAPEPESPYGASKLAGENVLRKWAAGNPSRQVIIIRPTVVFGPNNFANMYSLIRQIDSGFYFHLGKADNIKSIAYVENLVNATLFLKERMTAGVSVFNYADEPQLTSRQIGETIAAELKTRVLGTLPLGLAERLAWPFDAIIKLTGKNLAISSARIRKLATPTRHSAAKLFSMGFSPKWTTAEGLQRMVRWYREQPK